MNLKATTAIIALALISLTSCSSASRNAKAAAETEQTEAVATTEAEATEALPLPAIPDFLKTPEDRAAYALVHFWDALDPDDTAQSTNEALIEQSFANFTTLFAYTDEATQQEAMKAMLKQVESNSSAYKMIVETARKYLYEPNSPMYSEERYGMVLSSIDISKLPASTDGERVISERKWVSLNRAGTTASNFSYTTDSGKTTSLLATPVHGEMLLILYDPDCDHCHDILGSMAANETLNRRIAQGSLSVLAINIYDKASNSLVQIPANWTRGDDATGVEEKNLYIVRAAPSLYVLNEEHKVVIKDGQPDVVMAYLTSRQ